MCNSIYRNFLVFFLMQSCVTPIWSNDLNIQDLRLIPDPRLSTFVFGNYEPDRQATNEHYNRLFEGRSATEIIRFLEKNGYYVHFPDADALFFTVTKNVILFDYSARVELTFEGGIFSSANVTGWGIK